MSTVGARLRLWQLLSPSLPIGAYAYARGLEYAVATGWVCDEAGGAEWIGGQLRHTVQGLDIPVFARLYRAWAAGDWEGLEHWNAFLLAARESAELRAEDRYLGADLARLLGDLGIEEARPPMGLRRALRPGHRTLRDRARGGGARLAWVWCEQQVAAAVKLIPLGQTAGPVKGLRRSGSSWCARDCSNNPERRASSLKSRGDLPRRHRSGSRARAPDPKSPAFQAEESHV